MPLKMPLCAHEDAKNLEKNECMCMHSRQALLYARNGDDIANQLHSNKI